MGISVEEFRRLSAKQPKKNKYVALPTIAMDGIKCPSKKHAAYRNSLILARKAGELKFFIGEVTFILVDGIKHKVDFLEFWNNGEIFFVEVKGKDLALGRLKRKQTEKDYGIKIKVV